MPFGLTNTPAVFQALVNDVLQDMLNKLHFGYIVDILIFLKTEVKHLLAYYPGSKMTAGEQFVCQT